MIQYFIRVKGDKPRGLLPAATTAHPQSRDALEVRHRLALDDGYIASQVVKALSLYISLINTIKRFNDALRSLERMFTLSNADDDIDTLVLSTRSGRRSELSPFRTNLNNYRRLLEAHDLYWDQKLRSAIADTPSLAEALHGATCSNYFCTYTL